MSHTNGKLLYDTCCPVNKLFIFISPATKVNQIRRKIKNSSKFYYVIITLTLRNTETPKQCEITLYKAHLKPSRHLILTYVPFKRETQKQNKNI